MSDRDPTRLVVASRNRGKLREIRELLEPEGIAVVGIDSFPDLAEIVEDGNSFAENAAKKATETARRISEWVLGEDSGLEVDALKGAPGIFSARYSGPDATDEANNAKLLRELAGVPAERRTARYVCNVAVADPTATVRLQLEAYCRGRITTAPRGINGFGYDPYFLIPEYHHTFGELSPTVKRHLSHRGRAFERLVTQLVRLLKRPG
ncbi:MAG TPA: RdgB/HAM1 family non-canonical purine NTP pyrophosphatase [Planctomycetaceae bacterium]|jgi:XTP/dITP diphosphohydrolase|nr:RdgB/HAM1 family non-canonical purine NTP pyrophosphatase [Planctomycetaceae bacterium]